MTQETTENRDELVALRRLSARIGKDPALVQAAGGNTSIKQEGVLWIKASGTWLSQALERNIMVPVRLKPLLTALAANDPAAEKAQGFVIEDANPENLRPSIETTLHAAMPQKVVVHAHCVETIAWSARWDGETALQDKLRDFDWAWIPYVRPGLPLSRAIAERTSATTSVLVLANHGLVVAADSVAEAEKLLAAVSEALRNPTRDLPAANHEKLTAIAADLPYRLPRHSDSHAVALDPLSRRIASGGSLYPDHVIFLGSGATALAPGETPKQMLAGREQAPAILLIPDAGTLLHESVSESGEELARCLAHVTSRIAAETPVRYLTAEQDDELLNWDAEKYRKQLEAQL
ncbi:class II aldolase/adducin family protein [Denitrobaculum tricleocarpae]|uniref:Class II aldolase n=1 Tax=Denitrobaculum tricleocarpae TaxID=2591009 RepID=A0A545U0T9_9PROT|nr:class II aldolase/adducin family protein [Denitrobaculum tricleocarpae]TQV83075.1 class II aldolase [Denitrobaculum tricleocarpae]